MKILAVDLGTKCGIATNINGTVEAGTVVLATDKEVTQWGKQRLTRRDDPRIHRLHGILRQYQVDVVVFEDVEFQTYTKQTQLWSSYRTALWLALGNSGRIIECVPIQTLKKFATGGGADKTAMSSALKKRFPDLWKPGYDDNSIDALWLYLWAQKTLSRVAT